MLRLGRSRMLYYLYRLAGEIVPRIPPRVGYPLFSLFGGLAYRLNAQARAQVQRNIRHVLGSQASEARIAQLARATFSYIAYNYYDLFRLPTLTDHQVNAMVHVIGWENVQQALQLGKGVVMTSAHFGNIEVVLYAMLLRGVSITIPAERIEPPELFAYITRLRTSKGLKLIPVDGPMIELVRTLRRGGVAGIAGDRNVVGEGCVVTFFGAPARLPDGHVRLAMRTGAPLMLGFSRRVQHDRYEATFLPHFLIPQEGTEEERFAAGMRYVVRGLEEAIRQCPEQWAITTPIWIEDRLE